MNTLVLNKSIDFEQYQLIVDYFATIGIEITNPFWKSFSPYRRGYDKLLAN